MRTWGWGELLCPCDCTRMLLGWDASSGHREFIHGCLQSTPDPPSAWLTLPSTPVSVEIRLRVIAVHLSMCSTSLFCGLSTYALDRVAHRRAPPCDANAPPRLGSVVGEMHRRPLDAQRTNPIKLLHCLHALGMDRRIICIRPRLKIAYLFRDGFLAV